MSYNGGYSDGQAYNNLSQGLQNQVNFVADAMANRRAKQQQAQQNAYVSNLEARVRQLEANVQEWRSEYESSDTHAAANTETLKHVVNKYGIDINELRQVKSSHFDRIATERGRPDLVGKSKR